jgi:hypothetical protein
MDQSGRINAESTRLLQTLPADADQTRTGLIELTSARQQRRHGLSWANS